MLYSFLEDQTKAIRNETEIRDVTIRKEEKIMVTDCMIRHRNYKGNNWKISYNQKEGSGMQTITKGGWESAFFHTRNSHFQKSAHNSNKKQEKQSKT